MDWSEPITWKRVKDNAREIASNCRVLRCCVISFVLALSVCLGVRLLVPGNGECLPLSRMALICAGAVAFPLCFLLGAIQTGSVWFRKKVLNVSDSFSRYIIPYEQISSLGFERFEGKSYFFVKGVPQRQEDEVEVHVAMTAKYSEADIEAYLVQRGLGRLLAVTREVDALPIRTKMPDKTGTPYAAQTETLLKYSVVGFFVSLLGIRCVSYALIASKGGLAKDDWMSIVLALAWIADFCLLDFLLCKGANRKSAKLGHGISERQASALGVCSVLALVLNPAVVFAVLMWMKLAPEIVWTVSVAWQFAWMALVYGAGRLFRVKSSGGSALNGGVRVVE